MLSESQVRNKFNTLTLAEARTLNRYMTHTRPPIRTASVMNKPRPPPLRVTNLDGHQDNEAGHQTTIARAHSIRSESASLNRRDRRHSINHGLTSSSMLNSRLSLYSTNSTRPALHASQKLSDDSFVSAKSEMSETGYGSPLKQSSNLTGSKQSLAFSTYHKIKRLFRSKQSNSELASELDRSQTPPVCPPPPRELKSMNYINYNQKQTSSTLPLPPADFLSQHQQQSQQQSPVYSNGGDQPDSWQLTSLPVYFERNLATVFEEQKHQNAAAAAAQRSATSQRHSFMASYQSYNSSADQQQQSPTAKHDEHDKLDLYSSHQHTASIGSALTSSHTRSRTGSCQSLASSTTTDSILDFHKQQQNCNQAPATPYRFSFAQPLSPPAPLNSPNQKTIGLPPRAPSVHHGQSGSALTDSSNSGTGSSGSETAKQLHSDSNSSSGNSSNYSSQLNVITTNNCDRLNSLELNERGCFSDDAATAATVGPTGRLVSLRGAAQVRGAIGAGANLSHLDDLDATILSETSTLQGDASGAAFYMNKCAELERTVAALKNKLIAKEKELTELQLNQLNYDYTIDRLKNQVNKLDRENQQLKRGQLYAV